MKKIYQHTLSNGLTVIGEPDDSHKSCSIGFFVKTGARDETTKESGITHFLEHMMFKGTDKRNAIQLTMDMGNIGAQSNAYTSEENTVYYGAVIPEHFEDWMEILCDMIIPALDREEFDMERKVILEEIALYLDKPSFYFFDNSFRDYFEGHTCGASVLGSIESISAVSRDEMKAYYDRRYSTSNLALVATGKFDFDNFVKLAEKYTKNMTKWDAPREYVNFTPTVREKTFKKKNLSQAHLMFITGGPSHTDEERTAIQVLSSMIGDSTGSRLFWDIVRPGLAEAAICDVDERDGTGCILGYASLEVEKLDEVSEKLLKILNTPLKFSDEDLNRVKKKLKSRLVLSGETPQARLFAVGNGWLHRNNPESLESVAKRLEAVSRKEIERAVEKFAFEGWSKYVMVPE